MKRDKIYRHILGRFAGDGAPQWLVGTGKDEKPCQTSAEAERQRLRMVRHLRKAAEDQANESRQARLLKIADQIDACRPNKRGWCRHPACPCCIRTLQRWLVWTGLVAAKLAAKSGDPAKLAFLTVIPTHRLKLGSSPKHIKNNVVKPMLAKLNRAMTEAGVTFLLGAWDISVNFDATTDANGEPVHAEPRVQPHIHAIALKADMRRAAPILRAAFPENRAVQIDDFDGDVRVFAYMVKNEIKQRFEPLALSAQQDTCATNKAYDWATFHRNAARARKASARPSYKPLTITQNADVALLLDALGSDRRLLDLGFEVRPNKRGTPAIRPTAEAMAALAKRDTESDASAEVRNEEPGRDHDRNAEHEDAHGHEAEEEWEDAEQGWYESGDERDGHEDDDAEGQDDDNGEACDRKHLEAEEAELDGAEEWSDEEMTEWLEA